MEVEPDITGIQRKYPDAYTIPAKPKPYHGHTIVVPGVKLKDPRWQPGTVTMVLRMPPGFPGASPSGPFFTLEDLQWDGWAPHYSRRIEDVRYPRPFDGKLGESEATYWKRILGLRVARFFRWVVQAWNPNHDDALTYFHAMRRRFECVSSEVGERWGASMKTGSIMSPKDSP